MRFGNPERGRLSFCSEVNWKLEKQRADGGFKDIFRFRLLLFSTEATGDAGAKADGAKGCLGFAVDLRLKIDVF